MAEALDRMAAEDGELPDATLLAPAEGRAQTARVHARWRSALPPVKAVEDFVSPNAAGGAMRCRRIDPPAPVGSGVIMFIHGGGWAFCDIDSHEDLMRRLSIAAGMPVFACDYRLAPEHGFPAGLDDCIAFWRSLKEGTTPAARVATPLFVAGDSAGANLALALTLSEIDRGRAPPDGALLVYGAYGVDFDTDSYREHADGPGLTRDKMRRFWEWYCPAEHRGDFRAVPQLAPDTLLRALPPLSMFAAEVDPVRSDSEVLVSRLENVGRHEQLVSLQGLTHGTLQMGAWLPEVRDAIHQMGKSLRSLCDRQEEGRVRT